MARHRLTRIMATAALVGATSLGLVVGTSGQAQALDWGPADRAAVKVLTDGFMRGGVRAATPGVFARMEARCLASGPAVVGCAAGAAAIGAGLWYASETADTWVPWLIEQATGGETNTGAGCATWVVNAKPLETYVTDSGQGIAVSVSQTATGSNNGGFCYVDMHTELTVRKADGSTAVVAQNTGVGATQAGATSNRSLSYTGLGVGTIATKLKIWAEPWSGLAAGAGTYTWTKPETITQGQTSSRIQCQRPDGSGYEVNSSSLPKDGYVSVAHCDPGDTPVGMTVSQTGTGTAAGTLDLTQTNSDLINYPKCVTASGAQQGCYYRVLFNDEPCAPGVYECVHWRRMAQTQPDLFECMWGPYVMPLDACKFMERAYSLTYAPTIITTKNTDGDPDTYDPPVPDPAWDPNRPTPTPSPSPTSIPQATVTESPSPAPTVTVRTNPVGCEAAAAYHLGPVQAVTAAGVADLAPRFGITTVGGWRESDPTSQDHPLGLAADFMTNSGAQQGDFLSEYAKDHASALGIQYVIWAQHIWNVDRAAEGWRLMADRGSPTANHMDHVHITFKASASAGPCSTDPGDNPVQQEGCMSASTTLLDPGTWVIGPLKCLFIPQKPLAPRTTALTTKLDTHGPGPILTAVRDRFADFGNGAGCIGPEVRFHVSTVDQTLHPFSACDEPIKTVAFYAKSLTTVMISLTGAMALARAIAAGFGFNLTMGRPGSGGEVA